MKAAQFNAYGGPEVLEIRVVQEPVPGDSQILITVRAASINPFDITMMSGMLKDRMPLSFPVTPGGDFAGAVTAVGKNVAGFAVGDEVYGSAHIANGGSGSMAEKTVANADNTARKPRNTTFVETAALPLVGASAVQALEDHMKLAHGQKILIHGGAGGIGHIAIQLAKAIGAHVATTVGTRDVFFVKKLGADEIVDYTTQKFESVLSGFDAVFDTVGGEVTTKSFAVLKKGGTLVSMVGQPDATLAKEHGVVAIGQGTKTNTLHLQRLSELVEGEKISVHVEKVFPLAEIRDAFDYNRSGHPKGKVVVEIIVE